MKTEIENHKNTDKFRSENNFQFFFNHLSLSSERKMASTNVQINRAEDNKQDFLRKFIHQIESNYQNPDYNMNLLTSALAMSKRQLHRKCDECLNMKPGEFLREFRLNEAIQLIERGEPISNVAFETGFSTHSSFGRCFKKRFGCNPTDYLAN